MDRVVEAMYRSHVQVEAMYKKPCTEAMYRSHVQKPCTRSHVQEAMYRSHVQKPCTSRSHVQEAMYKKPCTEAMYRSHVQVEAMYKWYVCRRCSYVELVDAHGCCRSRVWGIHVVPCEGHPRGPVRGCGVRAVMWRKQARAGAGCMTRCASRPAHHAQQEHAACCSPCSCCSWSAASWHHLPLGAGRLT
jgi:hypothetical protein